MERFGLHDDQWDRIKDRLPSREGHVGGTAPDNRPSKPFSTGSEPVFRRDLPERFGYWKSAHQRFDRWAKSGVFERIFQLLASDAR